MAARPQARKRSRLTLCVGLAVGLALFFYLMSGPRRTSWMNGPRTTVSGLALPHDSRRR